MNETCEVNIAPMATVSRRSAVRAMRRTGSRQVARKRYCDDHLESMEAHAGLMDALDEFEREGEGE